MKQQASLLAAALTSGDSEQGRAPRNTGLAPRGQEGAAPANKRATGKEVPKPRPGQDGRGQTALPMPQLSESDQE